MCAPCNGGMAARYVGERVPAVRHPHRVTSHSPPCCPARAHRPLSTIVPVSLRRSLTTVIRYDTLRIMVRPRNADADRAIREATAALLAEGGYAHLTVEGVASRARVAKTTIYRRWPSKAELVFGIMVHPDELGPAPDTGRVRTDLAIVMGFIATDITAATVGQALLGILLDVARDPALAGAVRERFVGAERRWITAIVDRAVARGEVAADTDPDLVLDLLLGSVLARVFATGGPLDGRLTAGVVDAIVDGCAMHRCPSSTTGTAPDDRRPALDHQQAHPKERS